MLTVHSTYVAPGFICVHKWKNYICKWKDLYAGKVKYSGGNALEGEVLSQTLVGFKEK